MTASGAQFESTFTTPALGASTPHPGGTTGPGVAPLPSNTGSSAPAIGPSTSIGNGVAGGITSTVAGSRAR